MNVKERQPCFELQALTRPDVGSSKYRMDGIPTTSNAMLTRFLWPPLIPREITLPTIESLTLVKYRSSSTCTH